MTTQLDMLSRQRVPSPRNRMKGVGDIDMDRPAFDTPADGFSMNAELRYLPYRYFPVAVGQLDRLRLCRDYYRARYIALPTRWDIPIPAFGNMDETQRLNTGTVVYGFQFVALDGEVEDFSIYLEDICSGQGFFSQSVNGSNLTCNPAIGLSPVLIEPRCISGDPHPALKAKIVNKAGVPQRCQLLIMCAEPCAAQGLGEGPAPAFPWLYPGM